MLIKDDLPSGNWRIGKITELMTSFDNQVRAPKIKLASKRIISRPLCLIYPIECENETDRDDEETDYRKKLTQAPDDNDGDKVRLRPQQEAAQRGIKQIRQQIN